MKKRTIAIVFVLTVILPLFAPRRAEAIWLDTFTTYYTGSCQNLAYNGFKWKECNGTVTQGGTLAGTWRNDDVYDCSNGTITYYWYEYCNNQWVYRYSSDYNRTPTAADCHCT